MSTIRLSLGLLDKRNARLWLVLVVIVGVGIALGAFWMALFGNIEFDEGYNLQIPTSLVTDGEYRTTHEEGRAFDPLISTGPTVLLPIAISFAVFGVGLYEARVVMLLFFGATFFALGRLTNRLYGKAVAILAVMLVACLPDTFRFGVKVLGEMPGLFFFLLGVWSLSRQQSLKSFFLGGLLFGLASSTKALFFLALFPVAISLVIDTCVPTANAIKRVSARYALLFLGFALPTILWEAFQLQSLGLSAYLANKQVFLNAFTRSSGASVTTASSPLSLRIGLLNAPVQNLPLGWLLLVLVLVYNAVVAYRKRRQWNSKESARFFMLVFGLAYLTWWVVTPNRGYWRHLFPGYAVLSILTANMLYALLAKGVELLKPVSPEVFRKPLSLIRFATGTAVLSLQVLFFAARVYSQSQQLPVPVLLDAQRATARKVAELAKTQSVITYWGWYQSPEISFLSRVNFRDIANLKTREEIDRLVKSGGHAYVIVSYVQEKLAPEIWTEEQALAGRLIDESEAYQIYEYVPENQGEEPKDFSFGGANEQNLLSATAQVQPLHRAQFRPKVLH